MSAHQQGAPLPGLATRARDLLAQDRTIAEVCADMELSRSAVRRLMDRFGLSLTAEARRRSLTERASKGAAVRNAAQAAQAQAKRDADLERLKAYIAAHGCTLTAGAKAVGISAGQASRLWRDAGLPLPAAGRIARAAHTIGGNMRRMRTATPEEAAIAWKAQHHARRTAALPPVTSAEADDLVRQFLQRGGKVQECPKMAAAVVNNGDGWA